VRALLEAGADKQKDRPAQSLAPPWGRASRLQRYRGSAATECKTVIATSKVNWVTTLDCVLTPKPLNARWWCFFFFFINLKPRVE